MIIINRIDIHDKPNGWYAAYTCGKRIYEAHNRKTECEAIMDLKELICSPNGILNNVLINQ